MMEDKILDTYLKAYQAETDIEPSNPLMKNILGIPAQEIPASVAPGSTGFNPLHWFDLMLPRAVGWAMTGTLGVYIGLSSPGQITMATEEDLMYDQALLLITEEFDIDADSSDTGAETNGEDGQ